MVSKNYLREIERKEKNLIKSDTVVFPAINGNGDTVPVFFEIQQTVNGKGELFPTLVMTKVEDLT